MWCLAHVFTSREKEKSGTSNQSASAIRQVPSTSSKHGMKIPEEGFRRSDTAQNNRKRQVNQGRLILSRFYHRQGLLRVHDKDQKKGNAAEPLVTTISFKTLRRTDKKWQPPHGKVADCWITFTDQHTCRETELKTVPEDRNNYLHLNVTTNGYSTPAKWVWGEDHFVYSHDMTTAGLIYCLAVSYQATACSQCVRLCVFKFRSILCRPTLLQSGW